MLKDFAVYLLCRVREKKIYGLKKKGESKRTIQIASIDNLIKKIIELEITEGKLQRK